jgi:SH3-like domain-containing protein
MAQTETNRGRLGPAMLGLACVLVAAGAAWSFLPAYFSSVDIPTAGAAETTAATSPADKTLGPSGLPLPRFVSLKAEKVNVRRGPSSDHKVAWVFQRKGLPVEITAESDNWRRIRDSEGEEGWILQNMLSGKRTALFAPWKRGETVPIYSDEGLKGGLIARIEAGVVGEVEGCSGSWCHVSAGGYDGYVEQSVLWGVYPGETVSD